MAGSDSIDHDGLLELETHLRDEIDHLVTNGMTAEDAFEEARLKLGQRQELNVEYAKVHPNVSWQRRLLAMLVGYMSLSMLVSATHYLVYSLLERLLWRAGADSVLFTVPWSIPVNRSDYIGAVAPEGLDSWNQVSLATLIATGVRAILVFGLVWVVYRFVNGRSLKLNKLVSFCQSTQPRVIMATLLLGALYSQIVYSHSWFVRLLHFVHEDLKMSDNGWIQMFGRSVILPVTFWITPLALSLVGWIGFHAYRRDRLRGVYNVQALAVCGFVTAFFLLRAAAIMDWAFLTSVRLFGIVDELSLTPLRGTYGQLVNASLLVLILSVALSGLGLPTLGRFLKRLPLRPSLVIVSWVFLQWILIPFQVFFTLSGSGWHQWPLDEDLTALLVSCFSPNWVPVFFVPSYRHVYAAILTLVAVMLAWRTRMTSKPSPETKRWA